MHRFGRTAPIDCDVTIEEARAKHFRYVMAAEFGALLASSYEENEVSKYNVFKFSKSWLKERNELHETKARYSLINIYGNIDPEEYVYVLFQERIITRNYYWVIFLFKSKFCTMRKSFWYFQIYATILSNLERNQRYRALILVSGSKTRIWCNVSLFLCSS